MQKGIRHFLLVETDHNGIDQVGQRMPDAREIQDPRSWYRYRESRSELQFDQRLFPHRLDE